MSQTPQEQTTAQPNRRMTIVDFMTIGIFFVINMVVGVIIAFIGITPITYVMITPLQAIILGIPMMLFFSKVRKPGMLLVFEILTGLVSILLGLGPLRPRQRRDHGPDWGVRAVHRRLHERQAQRDRLCP